MPALLTRPEQATPMSVPHLAPGEKVEVWRKDHDVWRFPSEDESRVRVTATRDVIRVGRRADGNWYLKSFTAERHDGTTKCTNKSFTRWKTTGLEIITARPGHPWLVTKRPQGYGWMSSHHFADRRLSVDSRVRELAESLFTPPPSIWDYYPLLVHYIERQGSDANANRFTNPAGWAPGELRRAFTGIYDAHTLTRRIFGVRRHNFPLVAATGRASLENLCLAWQFRGLVPDRTLLDILDRPPLAGPTPPLVRHHLRTLDQASLAALATEEAPSPTTLRRLTTRRPLRSAPTVGSWYDLDLVVASRATPLRKRRPRRPATPPAPTTKDTP